MSKKLATILSTPTKCYLCDIAGKDTEVVTYRGDYEGCIHHTYCPLLKQRVDGDYDVHPNCPLIQLPDREYIINVINVIYGYRSFNDEIEEHNYNMAIEELEKFINLVLGGTEDGE